MKKLLFSVIAFTLLTTSCYKDDFKALNSRIDALSATVAGVPALTTAIATLTTNLASLQTAVTGLGTSVGTLQTGLTTLTTNVAAINTLLNTVATNVGNIPGLIATLTTLVNNNQTAALAAIAAVNTAITNAITNINGNTNTAIANAQAALAAAITAAQTDINTQTAAAITAAQTALTTLINSAFANTDANIAALASQLTGAVNSLNASIIAAQNAIISDNSNQTVLLTNLLAALQNSIDIANAQLQTLVSSNNVFIGDLTIFDEATLSAAEALGAKVRVITGNVSINTTGLDAGQMIRLKAVTNGATLGGSPPPDRIYMGVISGSLTLIGVAGKPVDMGSLVNVSGVPGDVTVSGAAHILSALLAVKGNYTVTGVDVSDDALLSVGGNLTLNYPAAYSYPNLNTVTGNIVTTDNASVSSISFPALTTVGMIDANTPTWNSATSIVLNRGNLTSLTVPVATTVTLGQLAYTGAFTLSAIRGVTLNMSATSFGGVLTITFGTFAPGTNPTLNINSLTTTGGAGLNITTAGTVTGGTVHLGAYSNNSPVTINGPLSQTLEVYTQGVLSSGTIQTMMLPVYRAITNPGTQFALLTALQNLTDGAVETAIVPGSFVNLTTLKTLTETGTSYNATVDLTGITSLLTVSTSGLNKSLTLTNNSSLTTVTTAGSMDYLLLTNCDALTTVNVGHNYYANVLGQGTHITIFDCDALTTFTTNTITGRLKSLDIEENNVLSNLDFSSFVAGDNITSGVVTMKIFNNKIVANYTQSVFALNSAPIIAQSGLASIKAYALNILGSAPHAGSFIDFGFYSGVPGAGGPWDNSIATLDNDAATFNTAAGDPNPGPNSFVQRIGDNNGQGGSQVLGSRINVARELGYVQ